MATAAKLTNEPAPAPRSELRPAGLSAAEVADRQRQFGRNVLAVEVRPGRWREVVNEFSNPFSLTLLVAAGISFATGERINAVVILLMIVTGSAINLAQRWRSRIHVERLRSQVAARASVIRDDREQECDPADLVPGDVLELSPGDLVPADCRVLYARGLHVNEAALTGESLPAEKTAGSGDNSRLYLGTSIVSGFGRCEVTAIGEQTQFAAVVSGLRTRPPLTEFERGLRQFSLLITKTIIGLAAFVLVAHGLAHQPSWETLLFAVALAVGLTPEFLPMIAAVTLSQGAIRMAKADVIVKHLPAIQQLGSIDVLCSDKTGTLTRGEMTLEGHCSLSVADDPRVFAFAYLNSYFHQGIPTGADQALKARAEERNPLDAAILHHESSEVAGWQRIDEVPFDFERRRLSVVVEHEGSRLLITKGAVADVLAACAQKLQADAHAESELTPAEREQIRARERDFSQNGLRVLAVAYKRVPAQPSYEATDETGMTFAGLLSFEDPALEDVVEIVRDLEADGVTLKVLTGDSELVTQHICRGVGIAADEVILGADLAAATPEAFNALAERGRIFARVTPQQKHQIVDSLRHGGHVVGFLGDGINDAPAIHAADVGISVSGAVDVAREAADIVLRQRRLDVIHEGILLGRKSFANVMKYLFMGTSSNFGNVLSMALASLALPFLPMTPAQIILNNFLYDFSQLAIPSDKVSDAQVAKPHRWDVKLLRRFMISVGPISSVFDVLTFVLLLVVWHAGPALFRSVWFVESLLTQVLVLFIIRTGSNPLRDRPSTALVLNCAVTLAVGASLPFWPIAASLGFTPIPARLCAFIALIVAGYLVSVEAAKRLLFRRLWT